MWIRISLNLNRSVSEGLLSTLCCWEALSNTMIDWRKNWMLRWWWWWWQWDTRKLKTNQSINNLKKRKTNQWVEVNRIVSVCWLFRTLGRRSNWCWCRRISLCWRWKAEEWHSANKCSSRWPWPSFWNEADGTNTRGSIFETEASELFYNFELKNFLFTLFCSEFLMNLAHAMILIWYSSHDILFNRLVP